MDQGTHTIPKAKRTPPHYARRRHTLSPPPRDHDAPSPHSAPMLECAPRRAHSPSFSLLTPHARANRNLITPDAYSYSRTLGVLHQVHLNAHSWPNANPIPRAHSRDPSTSAHLIPKARVLPSYAHSRGLRDSQYPRTHQRVACTPP